MKNFMKGAVLLLAVLAGTTTLFAENEIKVLRASSFKMTRYGSVTMARSYTLMVKNIAFEKKVSIHGQTENGEWKDFQAHYLYSAGNNFEVWEVYANNGPEQFAAKYEVDGVTYWDNNNSDDYHLCAEGVTLYNNINLLLWRNGTLYQTAQGFTVGVNLQNLGPEKEVTVVYTTDNWQTQKKAALHFLSYQVYGYGNALSPNEAGVEYWQGYINTELTDSRIEYAVRYEVNGQEYWDNNNGLNYVVIRR